MVMTTEPGVKAVSPAPLPVQHLVAQHQLGQPQHVYPLKKPAWRFYIFAFFWLVCGIGFLESILRAGKPEFAWSFFLLFWLLPVVVGFLLSRRSRTERVMLYLCSAGLLVWSTRDQPVTLHWDQVEQFRWGYDSKRELPIRYTFRLRGGATLHIDEPQGTPRPSDFFEVGRSLDRALAQNTLPGLLARLQAGQILFCGPINISLQGISPDQGRSSTPWSAIHHTCISSESGDDGEAQLFITLGSLTTICYDQSSARYPTVVVANLIKHLTS